MKKRYNETALIEEFQIKMEAIIKTLSEEEAFEIISRELVNVEDRFLSEYMAPLNFLQSSRVLDWIEENVHRSKNITQAWGHLAASSGFYWQRSQKWLDKGRPWSLVALDASYFCTNIGDRLNQSPSMRELNPKLQDSPKAEKIAESLQNYLMKDSVPRTRNTVQAIISNLFNV